MRKTIFVFLLFLFLPLAHALEITPFGSAYDSSLLTGDKQVYQYSMYDNNMSNSSTPIAFWIYANESVLFDGFIGSYTDTMTLVNNTRRHYDITLQFFVPGKYTVYWGVNDTRNNSIINSTSYTITVLGTPLDMGLNGTYQNNEEANLNRKYKGSYLNSSLYKELFNETVNETVVVNNITPVETPVIPTPPPVTDSPITNVPPSPATVYQNEMPPPQNSNPVNQVVQPGIPVEQPGEETPVETAPPFEFDPQALKGGFIVVGLIALIILVLIAMVVVWVWRSKENKM